jgi:hypothetical protein
VHQRECDAKEHPRKSGGGSNRKHRGDSENGEVEHGDHGAYLQHCKLLKGSWRANFHALKTQTLFDLGDTSLWTSKHAVS